MVLYFVNTLDGYAQNGFRVYKMVIDSCCGFKVSSFNTVMSLFGQGAIQVY